MIGNSQDSKFATTAGLITRRDCDRLRLGGLGFRVLYLTHKHASEVSSDEPRLSDATGHVMLQSIWKRLPKVSYEEFSQKLA